MESIEKITERAETLIEALPYIRDFSGKKVVVKYGGSAMLDKSFQRSVIKDVALLKLVGMHPIIVHGGGKEISKWLGFMGKESEFVDGLRVTDADTMEVAEMVLNKVNKHLVQEMEKQGVKAAGVCGKDGGMLMCKKKKVNGQDIGYVGEVVSVNTELIDTLIENDFVPIIAPVGLNEHYHAVNINADEAASAVAKAVHAEKLAFMTDIEGVCMDPDDPSTLISVLSLEEAEKLIEEGTIGGGMIPKIKNCVEAVEQGVNRVHILDGRREHCLLLEFFTRKGIGTAIIDNKVNLYPHENDSRE
ncbi:MAG: acetylglutamate kinase [Eubacterium sp.]|nr:acetylglutamate kinase [Eubacterium sp.]MBQ7200719.1 acetylglutamate kinase [Eubacterium sp.]